MRQNHSMQLRSLGAAALIAASVAVVVACSGEQAMTSPTSPSGGGQSATVQIGRWGGGGVNLDVGDSEARIEFACAHAVLGAPIPLDAIGSFSGSGLYFPEGPGPVHDEDVQGKPAVFIGRVTGDHMKLSVTLDEGNEVIGSYDLQRGKSVRVIKCQ